MAHFRKLYTLFQPTIRGKKSKIWYYRYWGKDEEGKDCRIPKSTGETTKYKAELTAQQELSPKPIEKKIPTLIEFTKDFFVWEKCEWIAQRHAQGHRFSKPVARDRRAHLDRYILPMFGKMLLREIKASDISRWVFKLELSNQTRNHILYTLRIILDEAVFQELIDFNPVRNCKPFADNHRKRDIFTLEEINTLFPVDDVKAIMIWGTWYWFTFFYLLLTSGLRSGEARALLWRHVVWEEKAITVLHAVKASGEIGDTKTGEARAVFLPTRTINQLLFFKGITPYDEDDELIFPSSRGNGREPMNKKTPLKPFRKGLEAAGISGSDRNLVVHSLRHTYNSRMRRVLPDAVLRALTGHRTEAMTERYDHSSPLDRLRGLLPDSAKIEQAWE